MTTDTQTNNTGSSSHGRTGLLQNVQKETKPLQTFINKFNNDWVMNFAGIMAYNLILAIFPIVIALLGITGLILHNNTVLVDSIKAQTKSLPALTQLIVLAQDQLGKMPASWS